MAPKRRRAPAPAHVRLDAFALPPGASSAAEEAPAPRDDAQAWQQLLTAAKSFGLDTRWGVAALLTAEDSRELLLHGPRLLATADALRRPSDGLRRAWRQLQADGGDTLLLREQQVELLRSLRAERLRSEDLRALAKARAPDPAPRMPPWGQTMAADGTYDVLGVRERLGLPVAPRHVAFGLRDVPQVLRTRAEIAEDAKKASERALRPEDLERLTDDRVLRP